MKYDPLKIGDKSVLEAYPDLINIKDIFDCMFNIEEENLGLSGDEVLKYILMVYSKDSSLNQKRIPLHDRKLKACKMLHLKVYDEKENILSKIQTQIFDLKNSHVFNASFSYLVFQQDFKWTEINVMQQEILEAQKIRMKPIEADDDKDTIAAAEKKDKLRSMVHQRMDSLDGLLDDFFADFEDIKKEHKRSLTIEDYSRPSVEFF